MNGRVAKKIRKMVYGDDSLKQEREYEGVLSSKRYRYSPKHLSKYVAKIFRVIRITQGSLKNIGKRRTYQSLKKDYMKGRLSFNG